jgi:5'-3' exonuclease
MGVPGLFVNLKNKYPNIITKLYNIDYNTYILFFDFNCLIHPVCNLLWSENKHITISEFENKIINKSIEYLEKIINLIQPTICAIFIDGVCPMAKIVQQRQRRFASILDKIEINKIRKKNNNTEDIFYDTNSISPGTKFMELLDKSIENYINNRENKDIKFIYSSYFEAGEGEHKIIQYIKNNEKELIDKNIMIYGLDADLIILSLTLVNKFNINLLRENNNLSLEYFDMILFNVNICAESIIKDLSNIELTNITKIDFLEKYNYIIDFIFITIFLGNDFIPPSPTLNMKFHSKIIPSINGYNILINTYKNLSNELKIINNKIIYLVDFTDKLNINLLFFKELIKKLTMHEQIYFENIKNNSHVYNVNKLGDPNFNSQKNKIDIEINQRENMKFYFPDPLKMDNKLIDYNIRKLRYIHHYFDNNICIARDVQGTSLALEPLQGSGCTAIDQEPVSLHTGSITHNIEQKHNNYKSQLLNNNNTEIINDKFYINKELKIIQQSYDNVISKYLKTFSFIMYYYFRSCPDNTYYYPYYSAILLSDLYYYLNKLDFDLNKLFNKFLKKKIIKIYPLQQLIMILPKQSYYLLPTNIKNLFLNNNNNNNIFIQYFTQQYLQNIELIKRDFLNKSKLYQCPMIMKIPSIDIINTLISDIYISFDEINRCLILK